MIGVHGNGLTHELWMPRTPKSTVIEIFYPNCEQLHAHLSVCIHTAVGYLFDYEMLARNMGHKVFKSSFLLTFLSSFVALCCLERYALDVPQGRMASGRRLHLVVDRLLNSTEIRCR